MIYRIIGETERLRWTEDDPPQLARVTGTLMGAMACDFICINTPAPKVRINGRARFWFTEAGWDRYGRATLAEAMRSGRMYRLLRKKNPPRSAVVYRDKWQVALLPVKH